MTNKDHLKEALKFSSKPFQLMDLNSLWDHKDLNQISKEMSFLKSVKGIP